MTQKIGCIFSQPRLPIQGAEVPYGNSIFPLPATLPDGKARASVDLLILELKGADNLEAIALEFPPVKVQ